ncbi:MAG: C39 family peptidase [Cyanobacteria bacterium NC_groundwater_1444_Ag_S-0.65um_54_12]|nr:C39 family peptidase [Cyanobacteria bacterium NC_groundwater_1444_Ag_S-0.65um_54_12]
MLLTLSLCVFLVPAQLPMSAEACFITQYQHPRFHPLPSTPFNSNCGPASLAMVLKAFKLVSPVMEPEAMISLARRAMTGSELPGSWTYPDQILAAAAAFGLKVRKVWGIEGIRTAMSRPGRLVIANLNPTPAYLEQLTQPYDGGHFAVIMAFEGDQVTLNDPLASRPAVTVTKQSLAIALTRNLGPGIPPYNGGIELWSPALQTTANRIRARDPL